MLVRGLVEDPPHEDALVVGHRLAGHPLGPDLPRDAHHLGADGVELALGAGEDRLGRHLGIAQRVAELGLEQVMAQERAPGRRRAPPPIARCDPIASSAADRRCRRGAEPRQERRDVRVTGGRGRLPGLDRLLGQRRDPADPLRGDLGHEAGDRPRRVACP